MSDTKFTPGPWEVKAKVVGSVMAIGTSKGWFVYSEFIRPLGLQIVRRQETEADLDAISSNAHLIAAAPELYEALASILYHDADLAKARGKS